MDIIGLDVIGSTVEGNRDNVLVIPNMYDEVNRKINENRIIILNEEVNDCIVDNYVPFMLQWNYEDLGVPVEERKPIKIFINSIGGDPDAGQALIDTVILSKTPVYTIGMGSVMSSAYLIYLSGHVRYSYPNTKYLQHEGELGVRGSTSKARDTMRFYQDNEKDIKNFILSRTKIDSDLYDDNFEREWYMTTKKAKELGVVQKILGVDAELDEIL